MSNAASTLGALIAEPDWFLDRVDPVERRVRFVRSDRDRLAATLFLDGRTPFAGTGTQSRGFDALAKADIPDVPALVLLHMSFCGSTHLAQLVGETGAAIVLKEPQALVDLADWRRTLVDQRLTDADFAPILKASMRLLHRRWAGAGPTIVKPSNWANNLVTAPIFESGLRAVMMTIGERAFLRAVFRGGRTRLAFTTRLAAHLAAASQRTDLVAAAVASSEDPLDRAAHIALVVHCLQTCLFAQFERSAPNAPVRIDYTELHGDPHKVLHDVLRSWGLQADEQKITASLRKLGSRDSKSPGRSFSMAGQHDEDLLVEQHHSARFDRALAWAEATLPRPDDR